MADDANGNGEPPAPDKTDDDASKVTFTPEQQAAIDKIVGGARTKAREQAKAEFEAAQAKAKKDAEEAALAKQLKDEKKFGELITQHETRIAEIEPALEAAKAKLANFAETIEGFLSKQLEELGEAAKTAVDNLPGEPDALAKLKWLTANEELFKKSDEPPARGTPPKSGVPSDALQRKRQQQGDSAPPVRINF
jgi:hypothetical protein